jgi:hypothetical protein
MNVRRHVLLLGALMVVPIFALRELDPFFRTGIPLLVPAAWGLAALLDAGIGAVYASFGVQPNQPHRYARRLAAAAAVALVVLLPVGLEAGRSGGALVSGLRMRIDWALAADHGHAREAAAFVNARAAPIDVVIVSPNVAWLYGGTVADFFQSVASQGDAIAFYPAGMPRSRFVFDPSPGGARYAVLDTYWDLWAREDAAVARLVAECEAWPLLWRAGDYRVHRRPDRALTVAGAADGAG